MFYIFSLFISVERSCVGVEVTHVMQIWASFVKPPIFLEGIYSLIWFALSLPGSLRGALSLLFSVSEDFPLHHSASELLVRTVQEWAEHAAPRRTHSHTNTHP